MEVNLFYSNQINASTIVPSNLGGKGRQLCELVKQNVPVPPFFVMDFGVMNKIISAVEIPSLPTANSTRLQVEQYCEAIHAKLLIEITDELIETLNKACINYFGDNYCISVRSSAGLEDGKQHSFAGLFDSVLNVTVDNLRASVEKVICSHYSTRVVEYLIKNELSASDPKMALVFQHMLQPKYSGVLFTVDVLSNMNFALLSGSEGTGDAVVDGSADCDTILFDRQKKTVLIPVDTLFDWNREVLLELFNTSLNLEELNNAPCDVEWCIDLNNKIWILQSRLITTVKSSDIKIYDNSNIVESYPGLTLPLTFGFARKGYEGVFKATKNYFLISNSTMSRLDSALQNMITHYYGRVYYQLHNWHLAISNIIASKQQFVAWERLVGIKNSDASKIKIGWFQKLKNIVVILRLLFLYPILVKRFFMKFEKMYPELLEFNAQQKATGRFSKLELFEFFEKKSKEVYQIWAATLVNDFFTFRLFDLLVKESKKINGGEHLANDLLCGMDNVESEKVIFSFISLCNEILKDSELAYVFKTGNNQQITDALEEKTLVYTAFLEHIHKYGSRIHEELKLETRSYRQEPELIYKEIKQFLLQPISVENYKKNQELIKFNSELSYFKNTNLWTKQKRKLILNLCRYAVSNRENMRLNRSRAYDSMKFVFNFIEDKLLLEKQIINKGDVFYLELDELKGICIHDKKVDLNIIEKRKLEYEAFKENVLPDRIIFQTNVAPKPLNQSLPPHVENKLYGLGVSGKLIEGEVILLDSPNTDVDVTGKILVTKTTDPGWVFLMSRSAGIISEKGSLLSHTAIIGRELGIPVVTGVTDVMRILKTGDMITMNGETGEIVIGLIGF